MRRGSRTASSGDAPGRRPSPRSPMCGGAAKCGPSCFLDCRKLAKLSTIRCYSSESGQVLRGDWRLMPPTFLYQSARDLFEAAREASSDVSRARCQLESMEQQALSLGGGLGSSSGGPGGDRVADAVSAMVDREAALERRLYEDYLLLDLATWALYGHDNVSGLASLVPSWWCDVVWHRYLGCVGWDVVSERVGYSVQRCRQVAQAAFDVADGVGLASAICGLGCAEG